MGHKGLTLATVAALCLTAQAPTAHANGNGSQTGRATIGCGTASTCHRVAPGTTTAIAGPMTLAPGASGMYTVTITSTLANFMAGGVDVAATGLAGATLGMTQANTQLRNGEITHTAAIPKSGSSVTVQFRLTAPMTDGVVTLQAAGNATNLDRTSFNDAWSTTTFRVTVGAAPDGGAPDASTSDGGTDAGGTDASADAPGYENFDPSNSMAYGGCAVSGSAPRGVSASLLGLGVALVVLGRRRRCTAN